MKLTWIEDLITLAETDTFSRAAALRHVSQPAFSRRIQMFEQWLGVRLVERNTRRVQFTETARRFEPELQRLLTQCYELRSRMRADSRIHRQVSLAAQHTLMISYLPILIGLLKEDLAETNFRVRTGDLSECIKLLSSRSADLLFRFEVENEIPTTNENPEFEHLIVGRERLVPVISCNNKGRSVYDPYGTETLRILTYPEENFFGQVFREHCLTETLRSHTIEYVCESAFAAGLKEMTLTGMGIAWLPQGLVQKELDNGMMIILDDALPSTKLAITAYRERSNTAATLDDIWSILKSYSENLPTISQRIHRNGCSAQ